MKKGLGIYNKNMCIKRSTVLAYMLSRNSDFDTVMN